MHEPMDPEKVKAGPAPNGEAVGRQRLAAMQRQLYDRGAALVWQEYHEAVDVSAFMLGSQSQSGIYLVTLIRRGANVALTVEVAPESNLIEDTFAALDKLREDSP